jgi:hypothetical protein
VGKRLNRPPQLCCFSFGYFWVTPFF